MVNWQMYKGNAEVIGSILDRLMEYLSFILGFGIFLQVVGGLLVFFGVKARLGGAFLVIYVLFSTLLYFPFWFYEGEQMAYNLSLFLKNLSILGGCLLLFRSSGRNRMNFEMMDNE